jgi:exodeoxyribonuclease V alpha subunit
MNAHRINQGELPESPEPGAKNADFYILERRDADTAVATIVEVVKNRIPRRFGFEPIRDIQVLTPMHKGPVGAVALNEALQRALNPGDGGVSRGSRSFRVGDKVMQLRNDYDRNVWNGDVGFVTRIDWEQELVYVGFEPIPKGSQSEGCARTFEREVAYEKANLDELVLAYACTVHKSQGSEYEAVVVVLMTSHFVMATRNLLYTAVTRGKKLVVLVGDPRAIHLAVTEDRRDERRTRLWHRLMLAFGAERSLRE